MNKSDEILIAQIEDKIQQCEDRYMITHSDFLDTHQRKIVQDHCRKMKIPPSNSGADTMKFMLYGGFQDAERCIVIFLPDYMNLESDQGEESSDLPEAISEILSVVKVQTPKGGKKLGHRDYLGSLLGLGLDRSVTGDILVHDNGADIVVLSDIADFIEMNYAKAGRTSLSICIEPIQKLDAGQVHVEECTDTVASLRLDNVVSSAFRISRSKAADAIRAGIVSVNSVEEIRVDHEIEEGDKIVLKGKGRVILAEVGGESRKGRTYVKYHVYG